MVLSMWGMSTGSKSDSTINQKIPNDYKRDTNSLTKSPLGEFQIITNKQDERPHQIDEPKSSEPELKKTQNNDPNQLHQSIQTKMHQLVVVPQSKSHQQLIKTMLQPPKQKTTAALFLFGKDNANHNIVDLGFIIKP